MTTLFEHYDLPEPQRIGTAHSLAIEKELGRLKRAEDADDPGQVLGELKSSLEAIAKVVLDLNGTPAQGAAPFEKTLNAAHDLLADQPGVELAVGGPFARIASSARKAAGSMAQIRNEYGTGHGRSWTPEVKDEMRLLAFDASMLWARWALRRLDRFAQGRPETLVRDLIGDPYGQLTFTAGSLGVRLREANLPAQEPRHARAIGVAVGQRSASGTFVVTDDGVRAPIADPDLATWPADYRLGVATGLLFTPQGASTSSAHTLRLAVRVLQPVTDRSGEVADLLRRTIQATAPHPIARDPQLLAELQALLQACAAQRPWEERPVWRELAQHFGLA
ncbi:abortive infection family protein [Nocardioidaceae bacterium]|nr:abortive infection family protein [Nocardioidaceae bacterium]